MNTVGGTSLRKRVVALRDAARDLEVDALVVERLPRDELADDRRPLRLGVRIGEADAVEAVLQPREVLRQRGTAAGGRRESARRRRRRR